MFDLPFDFFSLAIAIIGLIVARKAFDQIAVLRARLDLLETLASPAAAASAAPPPLPAHEPVAPSVAEQIRIEATEAEAPPIQPVTEPQPASEIPELPPPLPPAEAGFEERLGTRWVVWVGGLTLALGGFFMVRYSIEAGLLGPGVRTILGGAFALALLAAGEWTRRKESISAIDALPIANIPAILTAAGTAVAFATVYAAYALYEFLAPATAFVLLGMVALGTLAAALLHGPASASPPPLPRRFWCRPTGRISGRSISISPSSPRRHSGWRGSGCGAGSRSRPSSSRCSGPFRACNAGRRWSGRTRSM